MIKFSKKQLSMSLFILALNTIPSNSFSSDLKERPCDRGFTDCIITCQSSGTASQTYATIPKNFMMKEKRIHEFENIVNAKLVEKEDTINILDVDFHDKTNFHFLNKSLDNKNNLVNITITPNSPFLKDGVLSIHWHDLPENLKHLSIKDKGNLVIKLKRCFLTNCENLISFDSQGLENVKQIESWFLNFCPKLTSVNLRGLVNVTHIRKWFLFSCAKLTYIDLRALKNVKKIEHFFLSMSCNLKEIRAASTNQLLLKKSLSKEIKDLIKEKKTVFLIKN